MPGWRNAATTAWPRYANSPLGEAAEGYRAMDERRTIKALLSLSAVPQVPRR
ncbi:hypothetical protein N2K95_09490 [Arthrobacter zhaoxinii]|uniref:Uncharacterized protein n=1 Tax=Arthrobacter zhaoxinii TaxID=2964616 RepID=A0ABY5YMC4_9MICC|nr:hypothetical protein [Arthrobacter zhaoxinii]UWX95930.1 hypothetical protein N2K95_09490 [Arthrobacter zhaoxinii]